MFTFIPHHNLTAVYGTGNQLFDKFEEVEEYNPEGVKAGTTVLGDLRKMV
ncbi:MAG: hypothetical protein PHD01_13155 [Geobacteraceae bacterium]|nr:hypothetical protein [Geobacteraceae bacterium]